MTEFLVTYAFDSPAQRDGLLAALRERGIAALCRAEAGCLRYDYFLPCEGENELFLLEQWESPEAQQAHMRQPHFAVIGALKAQFGARSAFEVWDCRAR